MGFLIASGFFVFFAVVLVISGLFLGREVELFEKNKQYGKAIIMGYNNEPEKRFYSLLVIIPALHDNKVHNCTCGKIKKNQYPKGTVIDVTYAFKRFLGIRHVEVHLSENPPVDGSRLSAWFKRFGFLLLGIACILVIIGFITI